MNHRQPTDIASSSTSRIAAFTALAMAHGFSASAASSDPRSKTEASSSDEPLSLPEVNVRDSQDAALSSPKFTMPLRDTPQTISVIPSSIIAEQGATTLRDVLRNTPGITFQAGEGGNPPGDNLFIRGFNARTDMFVDGVRDTGQFSRDAFNLEQVEVAKGPSSSIAGRGSTGGAINQVSKTPQPVTLRRATLALGTDDYRRATLDANQALNSDRSTAFRLNAMWTDAGVPGRDAVENSKWGVAPSLAFGLGTPTQITIAHEHLEQDNLPDYGLPSAAHNDPAVDWSNFYGLKQRDYEEIRNDVSTLTVNHTFADGFTLRNLTRYGDTTRDAVVTAPRLLSGTTDVVRRTSVKSQDRQNTILSNQTDLDLRFDTGSIRHNLVTGLELTRENYKNHAREVTGEEPTTDLYAPTPDDAWTGTVTRTGAYSDSTGKTLALYAFDTIELSERWQLTGGLRWDRFHTDQKSYSENGDAGTLERDDSLLSYRAGIVYKPAPNGSIYAGFGTSQNPTAEDLTLRESGGRRPPTNHPGLDPEKSRNLELGTKWDLFNGSLSLTGALFQTEKTNARTRDDDGNAYVLAGRQTVRGVELGVSGRLTDNWSMFGGYAFMDSKVDESLTTAEEGHELQYTPRHSFNLWTTHSVGDRFMVGAGAQFTGQYYFNNTAEESDIPDTTDYWLFNAMAACTVNDHLTLRLNLNNLTDEKYVERGYASHFTPGPARSAILSADFRF
ncbi:MAG: TonB-dependent receptor [Opitutaceae bacterium]